MSPNRLEDLESVRFVMVASEKDIETIIKEHAAKNGGKVPVELAIAYRHLKQSIKALNFYIKGQPSTYAGTVDAKAEFNENLLNSGTDA